MNATHPSVTLNGADQPGVHPLHPGEIPGLEAQADALAYAFALVDMHGCMGKSDALTRIAEALHFPDWFGHNWDALGDCLTDMSWNPAPGYLVVLEHLDDLQASAPDDCATLLEVLRDAAGSQAARGVPLWFFVGLDNRSGAGVRHEHP